MFDATERQKLADYSAALRGWARINDRRTRPLRHSPKQIRAVHADLAQSVEFATKGQPLRSRSNGCKPSSRCDWTDPPRTKSFALHRPVADDVDKLTAGTGLAIVLRSYGLALRPETNRGQPVALRHRAHGHRDDTWPIGWESKASPRETAPTLLEFLNVEIEGYTLQEAVDAIAPRIKLPLYWDHAALAKGRSIRRRSRSTCRAHGRSTNGSSTACWRRPTSRPSSASTKPARRFCGSPNEPRQIQSKSSSSVTNRQTA